MLKCLTPCWFTSKAASRSKHKDLLAGNDAEARKKLEKVKERKAEALQTAFNPVLNTTIGCKELSMFPSLMQKRKHAAELPGHYTPCSELKQAHKLHVRARLGKV